MKRKKFVDNLKQIKIHWRQEFYDSDYYEKEEDEPKELEF